MARKNLIPHKNVPPYIFKYGDLRGAQLSTNEIRYHHHVTVKLRSEEYVFIVNRMRSIDNKPHFFKLLDERFRFIEDIILTYKKFYLVFFKEFKF